MFGTTSADDDAPKGGYVITEKDKVEKDQNLKLHWPMRCSENTPNSSEEGHG
jgi:hypothetical protein